MGEETPATPGRISFALDQNFPLPILVRIRDFIPQASVLSIEEIDPALATVEDCRLVFELGRLGFSAVVTNDYHMLRQPGVLTAARWKRVHLVAIEALGDDPVRATGAFLLDLPSIARRIAGTTKPQVFKIGHKNPFPRRVSDEFKDLADSTSRPIKEVMREDEQYLVSKGLGSGRV